MNIKLNLGHVPGGVFSKFMQMLPNAVYFNAEKIYFDAYDERFVGNPFNWVFNQAIDDSFLDVECINGGSYTKDGCEQLGAIEKSLYLPEMKRLCTLITPCDTVVNMVNKLSNRIDDNTLGVHVRLGDMNSRHPQFGYATTDDYISAIAKINPSSLFVASDNLWSIAKIIDSVDIPVYFYHGMMREMTDDFKESTFQLRHLGEPLFWQEAFTDMLLLAKCRTLLCRVSNLTNASILFSDTTPTIHRI